MGQSYRETAPYQCLSSPSSHYMTPPAPIFAWCISTPFCNLTCPTRCLLIFHFVCHVGKKKARKKKGKRNIFFKHTSFILDRLHTLGTYYPFHPFHFWSADLRLPPGHKKCLGGTRRLHVLVHHSLRRWCAQGMA